MVYWWIPAGLGSLWYVFEKYQRLKNGLPVLMYHNVTATGTSNAMTVSTTQLESQFEHLVSEGYTTIFLSDLLQYVYGHTPLPPKPVLITFDDGYKNNGTLLYPLLQQYGLKANIFLIAGFIRYTDSSSGEKENGFLTVDEIRRMDSNIIQFGLHSFEHASYNDLSIQEIERDVEHCTGRLQAMGIPYQPCLAYTYGAFPKKDAVKRNQLFNMLQKKGILLAFRIGNRLNTFPLRSKYLIQRIDVMGDETLAVFKRNLKRGRKIL